MSDDDLLRFSEENRPLRMEREENGDILILTPTGIRTGNKNLRIGRFLDEWAEQDGRGMGCDSSWQAAPSDRRMRHGLQTIG